MTDDKEPIDYEAEYKKVVAERDAYAHKLDEYIEVNNKLSADLKVQQSINRKTVGTSTKGEDIDKPNKVSLNDAITAYKESLFKGDKQ